MSILQSSSGLGNRLFNELVTFKLNIQRKSITHFSSKQETDKNQNISQLSILFFGLQTTNDSHGTQQTTFEKS